MQRTDSLEKTLMLGKIESRRRRGRQRMRCWVASLTQRTWVWVNPGSWWWTGRPGVLQCMQSQRVGHNWVNELNLEKEMATHSSTLAWKIPRTEEPGRLQSMRLQCRTRLSNFTFTFHFDRLDTQQWLQPDQHWWVEVYVAEHKLNLHPYHQDHLVPGSIGWRQEGLGKGWLEPTGHVISSSWLLKPH